MRTIVDLPKSQLIPLAAIAQERGVSRAELVRQAVALLLKTQAPPKPAGMTRHRAFGIWKKHKDSADAVDYQRRLRAEWDES